VRCSLVEEKTDEEAADQQMEGALQRPFHQTWVRGPDVAGNPTVSAERARPRGTHFSVGRNFHAPMLPPAAPYCATWAWYPVTDEPSLMITLTRAKFCFVKWHVSDGSVRIWYRSSQVHPTAEPMD
jgi:hypothetical protein